MPLVKSVSWMSSMTDFWAPQSRGRGMASADRPIHLALAGAWTCRSRPTAARASTVRLAADDQSARAARAAVSQGTSCTALSQARPVPLSRGQDPAWDVIFLSCLVLSWAKMNMIESSGSVLLLLLLS